MGGRGASLGRAQDAGTLSAEEFHPHNSSKQYMVKEGNDINDN